MINVKHCKCGAQTIVLDSRERKSGIVWRRRHCQKCDTTTTTFEVPDWYLEALESKAKLEKTR